MDFDPMNNLAALDQDKFFSDQWPHFDDPLPHFLSESRDDLMPLPESLGKLDDTMGFSPPPDLLSDTSLPLVPYNSNYQYYSYVYSDQSILFDRQVHLDDIDLDSFAWTNNNNKDVLLIDPPAPLNDYDLIPLEESVRASSAAAAAALVVGTDEKKKALIMDEKRSVEGIVRASRLNHLGFDEIKNYFDMPITKAAKEMNVGLTVLKKRCRELGIARWPHRKMKSLNSLIRNVQEMGKGVCEDSLRRELETLEEHRRLMEDYPEMQLTERTKKLRQACFKANYKRRRLTILQQQQQQQQPCSFSIDQ